MVSLKKEPKIREVTPVHLMDENEAVQIYCPPKGKAENGAEILIKQTDIRLVPAIKDVDKPQEHTEHTFVGLNAWEWAEIIIKSILLIGAFAFVVFFLAAFLGEGLTLAEHLYSM